MKVLDGSELAGFIKERQAKQVRGLRQAHKVFPKLAIIRTTDDPVIGVYIRLKKAYGEDILVEVQEHAVKQADAADAIKKLNTDDSVHGIILQLPLSDPSQTDELVNMIAPAKDVDGLGKDATLTPATPLAILWLLAGYNVELTGKNIVVVGQGRLVGAPLAKLLKDQGHSVVPVDDKSDNIEQAVRAADILITATGVPGLIKSNMLKPGAVVVDAGVATDKGKLVGDVDPVARDRHDLTMTPQKGGVGPLTICALFDNLIRSAINTIDQTATRL